MAKHDRKKWTDFPPEIAAKAREIVDGQFAFNDAVDLLQAAIDSYDKNAEEFWRTVFECYPYVVTRKGRGTQSMDEYHDIQTAAMFGAGFDPREDLTPEQQKDFDEYYRQFEEERKKLSEQPSGPMPDKPDDEIPFD